MRSSRTIHFVALACAGAVPRDLPVFRDPKTGAASTPDTVDRAEQTVDPSDRRPDGQPVFPR